jgi:hypothetical protein
MYSVIVSILDPTKLESVLLPSLNRVRQYLYDKKLPDIQIVVVSGTEALTKNYNVGLKQSIYPLKFFIHDDVDITDTGEIPLFVRIESLFNSFPKLGLIGLVGSTYPSKRWWQECPDVNKYIHGHVLMGGDVNQYWRWNADKEFYHDMYMIDGIFMATPLNIEFSEDIIGFHLYEHDYCHLMRKNGYSIGIITHLARHHWWSKPTPSYFPDTEEFKYYQKKWGLVE